MLSFSFGNGETHLCMTPSIMILDVRELRRVFERWSCPVEMSEPFMDIRVA
jgi:hypothetical protein